MSNWRVIYYKTAAGDCPVPEYLDTLEGREAAQVTGDIDLLADFGLDLGRPHVKHLRGKIWELRTHGRLQHRVLYFTAAGQRLCCYTLSPRRRRKRRRERSTLPNGD